MTLINLYPSYETAEFIARNNRFVLTLRKTENNEIIQAHIANPGRMEEFLIPGHPFFITSGHQGKYPYHAVSTLYQDAFVLLDTIKINHLAERLIKDGTIPEFSDYDTIRREVTVGRSKFDFLLMGKGKKPLLLEIKSCSFCHHGMCMFPDAPTTRGKRHLEDLETLASGGGFVTYTLYIVTHHTARIFLPNGHTDPDYCRTFHASRHVHYLAYSLPMKEPGVISLGATDVRRLPVDLEKAGEICLDRGSYLMVFYNAGEFSERAGALGEIKFPPGYYVYAGSALNGLEKRIRRHNLKTKKTHWHIDYLSPTRFKAVKIYRIRRSDRLEQILAKRLAALADSAVPGFGSSDSKADSHLFYFGEPPFRKRGFIDLVLDAQMFRL